MGLGHRVMKVRAGYAFIVLAVLAGCENGAIDQGARAGGSGNPPISHDLPPEAPPGTCWDNIVSPSITKTVTEQVLVKPAKLTADGQIENPPIYRNEDRQVVVQEGDKTWFVTPCPDITTTEFVASLQRALAARNLYSGSITGKMNASTRTAIKSYQESQGLSTDILSITAARSLGLVPIRVDGK